MTVTLPSWETYCGNTTAINALVFDLGPIRVWFSYRTPVAFHDGVEMHVRHNDWGPTTGKHLTAIDGGRTEAKSRRLCSEDFEALLADTLAAVSP